MLKILFYIAMSLSVIATPAQSQTRTASSWLEYFYNLSDERLYVEGRNIFSEAVKTIEPRTIEKVLFKNDNDDTSHIFNEPDKKNIIYAIKANNKITIYNATIVLVKYINNKKSNIDLCYNFTYNYDADYGYNIYYRDSVILISDFTGAENIVLVPKEEYGNATYGCQQVFDSIDK